MMNRTVLAGAVLGLFAMALLAPALAEARAGSGGSSGSRGSRSYSAPRSPSAPVSPAPSTSSAPIGSAPARPGGFLGGFGGMLGGLVVGGLLGSLLFGHGGMGLGGGLGGGIGLLDILLLAGVAVLVISLLRRRQPAPASPAGYAPGPWAPGGSTVTEVPSAAPADDDLTRGLAAVRMMDPGFDPARFTAIATDLFTRLQIGWSAGDLASIRAHLSDEMAVSLDSDLSRLRALGRVNHVEQVQVQSAELTEVWQEYGRDLATVRIRARVVDYTLEPASGRVVEGSQATPTMFEEFWTFVRPVGPNPWQVSAIQQPPA